MSAGKAVRLWLPVALYTGFIFWLSSAPRPAPPFLRFPGADKVFHLCEFAPLGIFLLRAFRGSRPSAAWKTLYLAAFLGSLAIGSTDEFIQSFVITRMASVWDAAADLAGASLGQAIYRLIARRKFPA